MARRQHREGGLVDLQGAEVAERTFIFSNVLERKRQPCVLALDDAHFAKGTFANNAQQAEVIEVDCNVRGVHGQRVCLVFWGGGVKAGRG